MKNLIVSILIGAAFAAAVGIGAGHLIAAGIIGSTGTPCSAQCVARTQSAEHREMNRTAGQARQACARVRWCRRLGHPLVMQVVSNPGGQGRR